VTKYVVFWDAGVCGTEDNSGIEEFENEQEAVEAYYTIAVEWAMNWQEEDESDEEVEGRVSIWAEEYDSEKHDGVI
jgi:hypothetical protein